MGGRRKLPKSKNTQVKRSPDEDEEVLPKRRRKEKTWTVCYNLPVDRKTWWMIKVRAPTEDDAWFVALEKLKKKEKDGDRAEMVYVKCVDVE